MPRTRIATISKDLIATRRELALEMYFAMPQPRSLEKLAVLAKERFGGGLSYRTLCELSRRGHWVQKAAEHDARQVQALERRLASSVAVEDLDALAGLKVILARQLKLLTSGLQSAQEEKIRVSIVESILRSIRELLGDASSRAAVTTHNVVNNNLVLLEDSPARRALADLERRVHGGDSVVSIEAVPSAEPAQEDAQQREVPAAAPDGAEPAAPARAGPWSPADPTRTRAW